MPHYLPHAHSALQDSNDGAASELDQLSLADRLEFILKDAVEGLSEKRAATREDAIAKLKRILQLCACADVVVERQVTLIDGLAKCIKRGEASEKKLAAEALSLLALQLGLQLDGGVELIASLSTIVEDASVSGLARAACLETVAWLTLVSTDDPTLVASTMELAQSIIVRASNKVSAQLAQDISVPVVDHPELAERAIQVWALLLPGVPSASGFLQLAQSVMRHLTFLLSAAALEVRVAAGQCIATLFESGRQIVSSASAAGDNESSSKRPIPFDSYFNFISICERLSELATDSSKFKAKKDKTKQRSLFRDVLHTMEQGEYPEETVKFSGEDHTFYSWEELNRLDRLRSVLAVGFKVQVESNSLIRDMFDLGPAKGNPAKLTGEEKRSHAMFYSAAAKARAQARGKNRDRRAQRLHGTDEDDDSNDSY